MRIFLQCYDEYFVSRFSDYVSHNCMDINFFCFSDIEKAVETYNAMGGNFSAVICEKDFLQRINIKKSKVIIVEEYSSFLDPLAYTINIYQSTPAIVADLKSALSLDKESGIISDTSIVAMFSTQGGSGKTTIAYSAALAATGQGYRTVYLNFEEVSSENQMHSHVYKGQVEKLIYKLNENADISSVLLETLEADENGVYTLPPFRSVEDVLSLSKKSIEYLIDSLVRTGNAKYIFVDLPTGFHSITMNVLEYATSIVQVYGDTLQGREKLKRTMEDIYYTSLPLNGKRITVLNSAKTPDDEPGIDVKFPISNSLREGKMISEIEEKNPLYLGRCNRLLEIIR